MNNCKTLYKKQTGLSLIELLIYIALMSTITLAFVSLSITISNSSLRSKTSREVNHNAQIILSNLNKDLYEAKSIDTTDSIFDSNNGRLILTNYLDEEIEYSIENGKIKKSINGEDPVNLTPNNIEIEYFRIQNTSTKKYNVSINYALKYRNPGKKPELDFSQDIQTSFTLLIDE